MNFREILCYKICMNCPSELRRVLINVPGQQHPPALAHPGRTLSRECKVVQLCSEVQLLRRQLSTMDRVREAIRAELSSVTQHLIKQHGCGLQFRSWMFGLPTQFSSVLHYIQSNDLW